MGATLAIDPGTKCGFALGSASEWPLRSGMWPLDKGPFRTRWLNLWSRLDEMNEAATLGRIVHELVERHPTPGRPGSTNVYAAHCYGAIVAVIEMWAEHHGVVVETVPVATLKKHGTGKGNAPKSAMVAAAKAKWPALAIGSDDQADALWLLDLVLTRKSS